MADKKKKFEIRFYKENGILKKGIFIENELLDYSVNGEDFKKIYSLGPTYERLAASDIENHFLQCLSKMVGRPITEPELKAAIRNGVI